MCPNPCEFSLSQLEALIPGLGVEGGALGDVGLSGQLRDSFGHSGL